ncbi:hypothetical protein BGI41_05190 [Methanobrevibacter sp. 87.7]|uniref:hypothetical protein n=1 Tax=Methanobrevibacter sp. 87.7 TaxID=387957 RepID=UPI000B511F1D|nr:hypothetical protein [Methanobrevibacter sp. 87.7]OWT32898.1 hypothetical protein BGI41_05190 [Methanobrevibacter sp. 87.7]
MSNKRNLDKKFLEACSLYENHDFDIAMEIFNQLILEDYETETILPYLIKYYLKNNNTNKVLEYLDYYLDDDSSNYELLILKASILLRKYKANDALEIVNYILEKDPLNDSAIMIKLSSLKHLGMIDEINSFQDNLGLNLINDNELSHLNNISSNKNSSSNNNIKSSLNKNNKIPKTEEDLGFVTADSYLDNSSSKNIEMVNKDNSDENLGFVTVDSYLDNSSSKISEELNKDNFTDKELSFVTADSLYSNKKDTNDNIDSKEDTNYNNIINDFVSAIGDNIYNGNNSDLIFNEESDYDESSNSFNDKNQEISINTDTSTSNNIESSDEDIVNKEIDNSIDEDNLDSIDLINGSFNENNSEDLTTFEIEDDVDLPLITEDYSKDFMDDEDDVDLPLITEDYSKDFSNKPEIDLDSLFNFDEDGNLIDDDFNKGLNDVNSNDEYDSVMEVDDINEELNKSDSNNNEISSDLDSVDKNLEDSDFNNDNNEESLNSKKESVNYNNKHKRFNHPIRMHHFRESTLDSFFNFS